MMMAIPADWIKKNDYEKPKKHYTLNDAKSKVDQLREKNADLEEVVREQLNIIGMFESKLRVMRGAIKRHCLICRTKTRDMSPCESCPLSAQVYETRTPL